MFADHPQTSDSRRRTYFWASPYYDGGLPVNEIAIHDADYKELAVWRDDAKRMQLAARDLPLPPVWRTTLALHLGAKGSIAAIAASFRR